MIVRNAHRIAALGVAVAASVFAVAAPAVAATQPSSAGSAVTVASSSGEDGDCDYGDFCLYYNSNQRGSVWDTDGYDGNLRNNYFVSRGAGQDRRVGNDSASYENNSDYYVVVCKSTSYHGVCTWLDPHSYGNFRGSWKNNVESVYFDEGH